MNLSKISRLVQLLGLLQAGKGLNVDGLATACRVSRRTIFRDLDVLRKAGVPLLLDDERGVYRIPGTYFLPPTNFTPDEALAVLALSYELGSHYKFPFYEAAHSAALKLESSLPAGGDGPPPDLEGYLMLVADGIGGSAAGERASAMVVEEAKRYAVFTAKWFFGLDDPDEHVRLPRLEAAINVMNDGRSRVVYHWPEGGPVEAAKVRVYQLVRPR